jgi:hypothetical protein
LHTLWWSTINISGVQVGLGFVQAHMQSSGGRPSDVPVGILEFRFVDLLRAMKLGWCT